MKPTTTARGFRCWTFTDRNGVECSLQKSSVATEDMIWLGCDEPNPKHLVQDQGWIPYPMSDSISTTTRMHLTRDQAAELLPLLRQFVETGELP